MNDVKAVEGRIQSKLEQLTKVELVRTAPILIEEIQQDLGQFDESKFLAETKPKHKDSDEYDDSSVHSQ